MSTLGLLGSRDRLVVLLIPDDLYFGLISHKQDANGDQGHQEYKDSDSLAKPCALVLVHIANRGLSAVGH